MMPRAGEDLLNLYMQNARETERDDFAELQLQKADAVLAYALACDHIGGVEYGNRLTLLNLIRAQRENRKE